MICVLTDQLAVFSAFTSCNLWMSVVVRPQRIYLQSQAGCVYGMLVRATLTASLASIYSFKAHLRVQVPVPVMAADAWFVVSSTPCSIIKQCHTVQAVGFMHFLRLQA